MAAREREAGLPGCSRMLGEPNSSRLGETRVIRVCMKLDQCDVAAYLSRLWIFTYRYGSK